MKFKINSKIKLNYDQLVELQSVLAQPDMGWGVENIYVVEHQGEYGTYLYRVNFCKNLITLLSVN